MWVSSTLNSIIWLSKIVSTFLFFCKIWLNPLESHWNGRSLAKDLTKIEKKTGQNFTKVDYLRVRVWYTKNYNNSFRNIICWVKLFENLNVKQNNKHCLICFKDILLVSCVFQNTGTGQSSEDNLNLWCFVGIQKTSPKCI